MNSIRVIELQQLHEEVDALKAELKRAKAAIKHCKRRLQTYTQKPVVGVKQINVAEDAAQLIEQLDKMIYIGDT